MAGTSEGVKKAWIKRKQMKTSERTDTLIEGMTLKEVAEKWNVSVKDVIKANGITSEDQIVAGMTVKIP